MASPASSPSSWLLVDRGGHYDVLWLIWEVHSAGVYLGFTAERIFLFFCFSLLLAASEGWFPFLQWNSQTPRLQQISFFYRTTPNLPPQKGSSFRMPIVPPSRGYDNKGDRRSFCFGAQALASMLNQSLRARCCHFCSPIEARASMTIEAHISTIFAPTTEAHAWMPNRPLRPLYVQRKKSM